MFYYNTKLMVIWMVFMCKIIIILLMMSIINTQITSA